MKPPVSPRSGSAPPIVRTPMRGRPWFGLLRGFLLALMPGMPMFWPLRDNPPWLAAARRRRRVLLAVTALCAAGAAWLMTQVAPDDPSWLWLAHATMGVLLLAWVGSGLVTALMGAWVLLRGDRHALALPAAPDGVAAPIDPAARTAVIMPICNEDITTVFAGLRATCESLAATGALRLFDIFILSDSSEPAVIAAEQRAFERLRTMLGDEPQAARLFYRRRIRRTARKSGNVADFCRRWGANYRYMVVLDADSAMRGDTIVSLVRLMEQQPQAGIVQTLPQAYGHATLHARVQQFATRVTGRLFALGMAYWQLGESHYWGHNAILRVAPFMQHCALAPIPGRGGLSGEILSHDFVEAAMMRRAGYEVWLAPQLEGSWEQLPPNLLDELQRDRRWCRGNLQNATLIAEPGWRPVHRVMLLVGALSYAMAPLWLLFVGLGLAAGAHLGTDADGSAATGALGLWALTGVLLILPRLLGVVCVRLLGEQAQYGGTARLFASAALELMVSAVHAPVRMLAHTAFVLGPLTGLRLGWTSPSRDAQTIAWRDALRRVGTLAAPLLAALAFWLTLDQFATPQIAALLVPLVLAVPLTVLASHPRVGETLRRWRLLHVPEEVRPPRALARALEQLGFRDLVPAPAPAAAAPARNVVVRVRPSPARRVGLALAGAALCAFVTFTPRDATTPELTASMRSELDALPALPRLAYDDDMARFVTVVASADDAPARPMRVGQRAKPARMIDNAVRERALDAVRRATGEAELPTLINEV